MGNEHINNLIKIISEQLKFMYQFHIIFYEKEQKIYRPKSSKIQYPDT